MTVPRKAPAARAENTSAVLAAWRSIWVPIRRTTAPILRIAYYLLVQYARSGWILVELVYVLALYLFAFGYPFEAPFFFETANWGLGLLAICATLLLVSRSMRPAIAQAARASASRRTYTAGLVVAAATLRIVMYMALLALVLLSHRLINATGGALFAGSIGLIAGCIVLATLALALSVGFAPRPARLIFLAWLVAALYSYTATNALAAVFFAWRLPLLPIFAGYTMGLTGTIGWGGILALIIDFGYVVGLALLADLWRKQRAAAPADTASASGGDTPKSPQPLATAPSPTATTALTATSDQRPPAKEQATLSQRTPPGPRMTQSTSTSSSSQRNGSSGRARPRR